MRKMGKKTSKPVSVDKSKAYTEQEVREMFPDMDLKVFHKEKGAVAYKVCGAIDIHKKILVTCVCITDAATFLPSYYVFKCYPNHKHLLKMEKWMRDLGVEHVCMESTGKYSLPIYRHLEKNGFLPVITNPKYVAQVKGQKTDERDAIHMANLFRMGLVTPSIIPSEELQDIRDLSRFRKKLVEDRTREKNRFQNALETSGIRIGNVLDDVFGKTGMAIARYLIFTPEDQVKDEEILKRIDPRCKTGKEDILESVKGYVISPAKRKLMKTILATIDDLNRHIGEIDEALYEATANYREDIINIMTVPGIARDSAISILAEVGNDMSLWNGPDQFISWCGLCPANNESAKKKKSTKIGKGGYYLKPILVQCALNAIKSKDGRYYQDKYARISRRRGKKKALIAICRMMMRAIYFILRDKTCWCPKDIDSSRRSDPSDSVATPEKELEDACEVLRRNGVSEETLNAIIEQCGLAKALA